MASIIDRTNAKENMESSDNQTRDESIPDTAIEHLLVKVVMNTTANKHDKRWR
jgi:hypothetical protein